MDPDRVRQLLAYAGEVMSIDDYVVLRQPPGAVSFRGQLLASPEASHGAISERLKQQGYIATLERSDTRDILTLIPHVTPRHRTSPYLAVALLLATVVSCLFVGGSMAQPDVESLASHPLSGLPFAASLLAILGVHEMAHYLTARHFGVQSTLPYFIPMPLGPFGTMGAFISIKSPPRNRRHLLRIAVAGPFAGLAVAIAVTLYGLSTSSLSAMEPGTHYIREGTSLLYMVLKYAVFGRWLPAGDLDVNLNPIAFAGWAGLMVTGLNLIPAAQLDGGHAAYALFGPRSRSITVVLGLALMGLGFIWAGWFLWSMLILFLGSRRHVLLDDITPLTRREKLIAAAALVAFALLFTPVPLVAVVA